MQTEELILQVIHNNQRLCDLVYTKIDRTPKEVVPENEEQLIKAFNKLVDINQTLIDTLHPNRKKVAPTYLKLKYS